MAENYMLVKEEIATEIFRLGQSDTIQKYAGWMNGIREARMLCFKKYLPEIGEQLMIPEDVILLEEGSQVPHFLKFLWCNDGMGSVGRGRVSLDLLQQNVGVFWKITKQLYQGLRAGKPLSQLMDESSLVLDNRGELRAVRLRAIALLSDLKFGAFYTAGPFHTLCRYLGIEAGFPDDGPRVQELLRQFLRGESQMNEELVFVFPWIVYEELARPALSSGAPPAEETEEIPETKPAEEFNIGGQPNTVQQEVSQRVEKKGAKEESPEPQARRAWWINLPDRLFAIRAKKDGMSKDMFEIHTTTSLGEKLFRPYEEQPLFEVQEHDTVWVYDWETDRVNSFLVLNTWKTAGVLLVKRVSGLKNTIDWFALSRVPDLEGFSPARIKEKSISAVSDAHSTALFRFITAPFRPGAQVKLHSDDSAPADCLQYDLYAEAIATIIRDPKTQPPLNIAIIAPWGQGKTTLMRYIRKRFDEATTQEPPVREEAAATYGDLKDWILKKAGRVSTLKNPTVWFNPWKYQSSEQLWSGLGHTIITQLVKKLSPLDQEKFWLRITMRRFDRDKLKKELRMKILDKALVWIIATIFALGAFAVSFLVKHDWPWAPYLGGGMTLAAVTAGIAKRQRFIHENVEGKFSAYIREPDYQGKLGVFHEINEDLTLVCTELIDKDNPAIVFIDDLDRCSPKVVTEVIEAINLMMTSDFRDKCYFILGMDAQMVSAALDASYATMAGKFADKEKTHGSVGWYFLDKFIQLPFFIPVLNPLSKKDFVGQLFATGAPAQPAATIAPEALAPEELVKAVKAARAAQATGDEDGLEEISMKYRGVREFKEAYIRASIEDTSHDSPGIREHVLEYVQYLDSSPRNLKRFANMIRFYNSQQQLRNIERPDPMLLAPTQEYFLRENLRLRLLNARLALLERNERVFRTDLQAAGSWITRHFDPQAKQVVAVTSNLKQLSSSGISIEIPDIGESLAAVRSFKAASEKSVR